MRYLSVCSGIEAATVAWKHMGWAAAAFSEIENFPRAVLSHHYPNVPLHGDFTTLGADDYGPIDLLVGGTPCQSFSVAGLRKGLDDDRGNLSLEYLRLADRKRPRWLVWENVPGVLSSGGGRDFGSFLGALDELGYGFAWRVLDAQYFGVAQRRRRVFLVGHAGDWRCAGAVLFERHCLQGHSAPRRKKGQGTADNVEAGPRGGGWPAEVAPTLDTYYGDKMGLEDQHVFNQRGGKFVPTRPGSRHSAGDTLAVALQGGGRTSQGSQGSGWKAECSFTLNTTDEHGVAAGTTVRRLTPRECERLQGFPDDYTLVPFRGKPAADGPRYKALGNSMAVPVMRWIGERIQAVETLADAEAA